MSRRVITKKEAETLNSDRFSSTKPLESSAPEADVITSVTGIKLETSELTTKVDGSNAVKEDTYLDKLVKYIPMEIIAAYLFINGILSTSNPDVIVNWIAFGVLLILTPVYIWRVTLSEEQKNKSTKKKPAWGQMIIAFFSFAIWVYAIGGPFASLSWYNQLYGSVLVALYTVAVPVLRK